jgi:DNA polymerase-1
MGDTIDNIQGVDKVGSKTAAKLLNTYGSIENIYNHLDELTPAIRKGFEDARSRIPVLLQMTTAAIHLRLPMTPDDILKANYHPSWGEALEWLKPLGLRALIDRAQRGLAAQEARAQRLALKP